MSKCISFSMRLMCPLVRMLFLRYPIFVYDADMTYWGGERRRGSGGVSCGVQTVCGSLPYSASVRWYPLTGLGWSVPNPLCTNTREAFDLVFVQTNRPSGASKAWNACAWSGTTSGPASRSCTQSSRGADLLRPHRLAMVPQGRVSVVPDRAVAAVL
jgi:hypothetical protein